MLIVLPEEATAIATPGPALAAAVPTSGSTPMKLPVSVLPLPARVTPALCAPPRAIDASSELSLPVARSRPAEPAKSMATCSAVVKPGAVVPSMLTVSVIEGRTDGCRPQ